MEEVFAQIAENIIEKQEAIIGPVALEQAGHVPNLKLDWDNRHVSISGNGVAVINNLVEAYKSLFGQISVEVSKEAAAKFVGRLPADQQPEALK
jgi:hypothetical protein